MLQHASGRVPVTAIALNDQLIFAGAGPALKVFKHETVQLVAVEDIFESQAIHGIVVHPSDENCLAVWGGQCVSVIKINYAAGSGVPQLEHVLSAFKCPDWILHAAFKPSGLAGEYTVALVTAHNALLCLNIQDSDESTASIREYTSQSKCILYSACLSWTAPDTILVASGTVFGEIIVWSCVIRDRSAQTATHYVLTGHEGSVFGVDISRPIDRPGDSPLRLLASCSDDRTVRIWDITDLPQASISPQEVTDFTVARETGFGSNISDVVPEELPTNRCITYGWGHASRIWTVTFTKSSEPDTLKHLITFGEDATYQLWSLKSSPGYRLDRIASSSLHSGKNLWSSALLPTRDGSIIVAAGGADGAISVETISLPFAAAADSIRHWSIQNSARNTGDHQSRDRADKLRSYAFIDRSELIVTADSGSVYRVCQNKEADPMEVAGPYRQQHIAREADLKGYSTAAGLAELSTAFVSGKSGSVYVYHATVGLKKLAEGYGKTAALFAQRLVNPESRIDSVTLLATTVEQRTARLFISPSSQIQDPSASGVRWPVIWLRVPSGFVITSYDISVSQDDSGLQYTVALGSRTGTLAVYIFGYCAGVDKEDAIRHCCLIESTHGFDAITDLSLFRPAGTKGGLGFVVSARRDGRVAMYSLSSYKKGVSLRLLHRTAVPGATSVERLLCDFPAQRLLVCGFRSKHFILYDMMEEREISTIDCGGPNRTWAFEPSASTAGGALVWTKASQLCIQEWNVSIPLIAGGGGHGREIKAVAVSPNGTTVGRLIATGAEDTDIKISACEVGEDGQYHFRNMRTLKQHNTGIQHLQWSDDGHYLFSSGGFEELFVWRIRPVPLLELGILCESACPTDSELPDLRIMSFAVKQRNQATDKCKRDEFIVNTVRSDSTMRIYLYTSSADEQQWSCLFAGSYSSSCLTQIVSLPVRDCEMAMVASTDGHVAMFEPVNINQGPTEEGTQTIERRKRFKIHQNTVHRMHAQRLSDNSLLLFTGGDDNALGLSRFSASSVADGTVQLSTAIIPRAHAAAVTGLVVIDIADRPDSFLVVTGSIDQRLKSWEVSIDTSRPGVEGMNVRKLQNVFTPVADVSSLALLETNDGPAVVVCGVGFDIWNIRQ